MTTIAELNTIKAGAIPGWMQPVELAWLAWQASQRTHIVEIGSFLGRSTRALGDNTPGKVIAVDLWEGGDEYKEFLGDLTGDQLFEKFKENVAGTSVVPLRMSSLAAAKELSNQKFDMIFIDGAHDYTNVKADILAWRPLVQPGGILCGHDFRSEFPEVTQAVLELFPAAQLVAAYTSIWGVQV